MNQQELNPILNAHEAWLAGKGGERADLSGCNLSGLDLSGRDLTGAILTRANLDSATLVRALLGRANLIDAILFRANLTGATLVRADLVRADLADAILFRANLVRANMDSAILVRAVVADAYLFNADLRRADLDSANLTGANLRGTGVTATQLGQYPVIAQPSDDGHVLQIGCMRLSEAQWHALTEKQALQMDGASAVEALRVYGAAVTALLDGAKADFAAREVT